MIDEGRGSSRTFPRVRPAGARSRRPPSVGRGSGGTGRRGPSQGCSRPAPRPTPSRSTPTRRAAADCVTPRSSGLAGPPAPQGSDRRPSGAGVASPVPREWAGGTPATAGQPKRCPRERQVRAKQGRGLGPPTRHLFPARGRSALSGGGERRSRGGGGKVSQRVVPTSRRLHSAGGRASAGSDDAGSGRRGHRGVETPRLRVAELATGGGRTTRGACSRGTPTDSPLLSDGRRPPPAAQLPRRSWTDTAPRGRWPHLAGLPAGPAQDADSFDSVTQGRPDRARRPTTVPLTRRECGRHKRPPTADAPRPRDPPQN